MWLNYCEAVTRVEESARSGGGASSIAKDLIDGEDPKHTLFCEIALVAIYALFQRKYSHPFMPNL